MKCKKYSYLIITILMLLIGINNVSAKETKMCFYMRGENKVHLEMLWDRGDILIPFVSQLSKVTISKVGETYEWNAEGIANWWSFSNAWRSYIWDGTVDFGHVYSNFWDANSKNSNHDCPKYLVVENESSYYVWATDSKTLAEKAEKHGKSNGVELFYVSNQDENNNQVTEEDYYAGFVFEGIIDFNEQGDPTCADFNEIFGDKDDPDSLRYLIDTILGYVRIIVPILIILLGTLDFAKAVIAGKEDNMKKAQTDFIKRVLIGVAVFFVPLLVDVVMELADIVWAGEYTSCKL